MKDYYVITDFETTGLKVNKNDLPIEVGMLLVDEEYNVLEILYSYINPFGDQRDKAEWTEYEQKAQKIHKIPFNTIIEQGKTPLEITKMVDKLLSVVRDTDSRNNIRIIIMSDNGRFDYNAMEKLYELAGKIENFPFHYAAWDVNILINSVQKVPKGKGSHKALQDAFRTHKAVLRALERNTFRKWEK
jgi:DNA polymerase III epsilon subunit-like protein